MSDNSKIFSNHALFGIRHGHGPNRRAILPLESQTLGRAIGFAVMIVGAGILVCQAGCSLQSGRTTAAGDGVAASSSATQAKDDQYVAAVRNGILASPYDKTTIGKAFEATFTDSKWTSGETSKGERFVEFTGRLKPEMYRENYLRAYNRCVNAPVEDAKQANAYMDSIPDWKDRPRHEVPPPLTADEAAVKCDKEEVFSVVKFQWTFTADGKLFDLNYYEPTPWNVLAKMDLAHVLPYIYN